MDCEAYRDCVLNNDCVVNRDAFGTKFNAPAIKENEDVTAYEALKELDAHEALKAVIVPAILLDDT